MTKQSARRQIRTAEIFIYNIIEGEYQPDKSHHLKKNKPIIDKWIDNRYR
jgi:hypothetical protein